jgi:uncharacterized repeat protein (TIGR01451 family)
VNKPGRKISLATRSVVLALIAAALPTFMSTAAPAAAADDPCVAAATTLSTLCVVSSTDGATTAPYVTTIIKGHKIPEFKWLLNEDDSTGDPSFTANNVAACLPARAAVDHATALANPALAIYEHAGTQPLTSCPWPSVHASAGHSTVIASGDQHDVANIAHVAGLGDHKYLISVTAAAHKIDGIHFEVRGGALYSVNEEPVGPGTGMAKFVVTMNPLPKKTATVRVHVYNDNASTNGQWDGQTETLVTCADATPTQVAANCGGSTDPNLVGDPSTDMSGFSIQITDVLAATTTDVYGSPLCTQYETDGNGNTLLNDDGTPNPISFGDGGASGGALAGTDSTCLSDHYGDIVIPNMGPNRYAATVIAPDPRTHGGDKWVQTTTLEGGHDWDTWNIEGGTGYDTELIVGGERVTPVAHGFVKLTHSDQVWNEAEAQAAAPAHDTTKEQAYYNASAGFTGGTAGNGEIKGTLAIGRSYVGSGGASPLAGTNLANSREDGVIEDGLVSVSCLATCNAPTDTTVWTGRARADGTFDINHLQTGDYSVAFWDEAQSYIMAILQYHVTSSTNPTVTVTATTAGATVDPTVTFSANPNLNVGDTIFFTSTNATWSGNFDVLSISTTNPLKFTLRASSGPNPTVAVTGAARPTVNVTDVGHILLPGWFTDLRGTVFNDLNGDGVHDPNEPGIPDFVLTERTRGNSLQDQGAALAVTNDEGEYDLSQGYPLGQFLIAEAYNPRYKNTGFTYTTDNDPTQHTVVSAQVDVDFLPIIGLSAHLDWGVQAYGTGTDYWSGDGVTAAPKHENGGIVGTVTYDVTRNEFDPAFSVQEDYQPGLSGISMQLWKTRKTDGIHADTYAGTGATGAVKQIGISRTTGLECTRDDTLRGTNAVTAAGQDCKPYDYYVTESWQRPVGCSALDVNGHHLNGELALPDAPGTTGHPEPIDYSHNPDNTPLTAAQAADCIESPMNGFQIGGNGTVDGNYALTSLIKPATITAVLPSGTSLEDVYADSQNNPAASAPLTSGDYVVEAVNPVDTVNAQTSHDPTMGGYVPAGGATAKRLYRFTDEKAINVMSGDTYVPQDGFVPTGDAGGGDYSLVAPTSKIRVDRNSLGAGTVARCAGGTQVVPANTAAGLGSINPDLNAAGGNPYAGQTVPVCDAKLVQVVGGRSMNPAFFMYTDVPIPSKFYGLVNDDLNVNVDRRSILLGEVAPASNVPVGVYDENGNWKLTAHSDVNGFYEILVPSMDTYNCPLPAGPCPNMYRLVGNDPGTLEHRNLDYNPQFRTIATEFQAWTGVVHPVDQAPTHQGITIEGPAAQFGALSLCKLADNNPTLFRIDKPFYDPATDATHQYVIQGTGFGATRGTLSLGTTNVTGTDVVSWTDSTITFTVPSTLRATNSSAPGAYQLTITNATSRLSTVNGVTFHRLSPASGTGSTTYLKRTDVYEVTPQIDPLAPPSAANIRAIDSGRFFTPVHDAWDAATNSPAGFFTPTPVVAGFGTDVNGLPVGNAANTAVDSPNGRAIQRAVQAAYNNSLLGLVAKLVVIYPNTAANYAPHNPNAAYFENVVLHGRVKLQGVGPGGALTSTAPVLGTNVDASQFWSATQVVPPGANQDTADGSYSDDWRTFAASIPRIGTGPADLPEGEGVLALAQFDGQVAASGPFHPGVDGILLTGGDQQGNPGNVNTAPGAAGNGNTAPTPVGPAQGGAIMADQFVRDFSISNNQIQSNGGTYGTIRIGTPDLPGDATATSNHNDGLTVANNRIVANGGTNLAGALGIFAGANNYVVAGNDFCGNFSAEYGGAISHYGASPGGRITNNRIYYNQGYDEGGGIMIAGALPANNGALSPGAGALVGSTRTGVTIDQNMLISNQSNDDGGGIRFLMAGNFPFLVQNNIIANNLSTHEGGGIALDDAPNVALVNNTIVKNITTATAATNGAVTIAGHSIKPANPAGLSTGYNSALLQPTLPPGSPLYSNPLMFNNVFADNRAGWAELPTTVNFNESAIHGIGDPLDTAAVQRWDMGVVGGTGALAPTNSVLNSSTTLVNAVPAGVVTASPTNSVIPGTIDGTSPAGGIGFVNPQDFLIDSLMWRNNTNTSFPVIVAHMVPVNMLADYHLLATGSRAFNLGANSKAVPTYQRPPNTLNAPTYDIDGDGRPAAGGFDSGADELTTSIDFAVTKTASVSTVNPGGALTYTVTATNNGPIAGAATVTDTLPAGITGSWTCTATGAGSTCPATLPNGNLTATVTLAVGGTATFVLTATVSAAVAPGSVVNTATVAPAAGSGLTDTTGANNTASVTVTVPPQADLGITKSDGLTNIVSSGPVRYTITVSNAGPSTATGAAVVDTFPATITGVTWTCSTTGAGSSCPASGSGNINTTVNLPSGGVATFIATGTVSATATGTLSNTAIVTAPGGTNDANAANNSATDTDTIIAPLVRPTLNVLDNFNRTNTATLGGNWTQAGTIAVNTNQASSAGGLLGLPATAYWNVPTTGFGAKQGAAFTFVNATVNNASLILKASGTTVLGVTPNFIRVQYQTAAGGQVVVQTTTNLGVTFTTVGTFVGSFVNGDTLTAVANADGSIDGWKTTAANVTTYLGRTAPASGFTGSGRIGMQLPNGTRVDNFAGGTVP